MSKTNTVLLETLMVRMIISFGCDKSTKQSDYKSTSQVTDIDGNVYKTVTISFWNFIEDSYTF